MKQFEIGGTKVKLPRSMLNSEYLVKQLTSGQYEQEERYLIQRYHSSYRDLDVIELGGGLGIVSMEIDKRSEGEHVVVEADPRNIEILEETRELNVGGFDICHAAYEPHEASVELKLSNEFWNSALTDHQYLDEVGTETVDGISLGELRYEYTNQGEFVLVSDIEGAEEMLLEEREQMEDCQLAIIELHSREDGQLQTDWFTQSFGMDLEERRGDVIVCTRSEAGEYSW